jgi:hypothetical protein
MMIQIGDSFSGMNRKDEALDIYNSALHMLKELNANQNDMTKCLKSMANLAVDLASRNKVEEAFSMNDKVMEKIIACLGAKSPYIDFASNIMANSLNNLL